MLRLGTDRIEYKKKISEVFSVNNLMISDFFISNRNINQFTNNLKKRKSLVQNF